MFRIFDGREHFYQWDLNRKIVVADSSIKEVHFCNRTDDCSLVVEVKNGMADVPNILLQDNWRINVYAYDGEATKHSAIFEVKAKSKPADYIYTETEVKRWEDLAQRIEDATTPEAIRDALGESALTSEDIVELDLEIGYPDTAIYNANTVNGVMTEVVNMVSETLDTIDSVEEIAMDAKETTQALDAEIKAEIKRVETESRQNFANAVYGYDFGVNAHAIDISITNPEINIKTQSPNSSKGGAVIASSRNLATIIGRNRETDFGTAQNTSTRKFYGTNLVLNVSGSNYYTGYNKDYSVADWITYDKATETFTLPYNANRNGWYGVGIDVRVKPSTVYYLCGETLTDNSVLVFAQYDKSGNYLTFASITGTSGKITTHAEASWGLIIFASKTKADEAKFKNVIFMESKTAPTFEPATEVIKVEVDRLSKAIVPRIAKDMCISCCYAESKVEINYTKDLNAVINTLTQAIISLGGNI